MTACKYCSAAAMGNAERGIGCSFQLARMWDQFALHALTNCHLCKNGHRWIERLSTSGASLALLPHRSGVAQRKRVGLITQRSEDRNLPPLLLEDRSLPPELFLVGVVGNISACHADAPGSIPGRGAFCHKPTSSLHPWTWDRTLDPFGTLRSHP